MLANGTTAIIWGLVGTKVPQPILLQNFPRSTGWRRISYLPTSPFGTVQRPLITRKAPNLGETLPTNCGLCNLGLIPQPQTKVIRPSFKRPAVVHELPIPAVVLKISGISKNSAGNPLANATMNLFRVDIDGANNLIYTFISSTISDGSGNYSFNVNRQSNYMVTSVDSAITVAGVTLNNLVGS